MVCDTMRHALIRLALVFGVSSLVAAVVWAADPAPAVGVPPARLEKLTQGINLSHWFGQGPRGYPRQHLETYDTAADMALIRSLGFLHVRWTFNEATVLDREKPGVLDAACRNEEYTPELFQEYAGIPLDALWAEFNASLRAAPGPKAASSRP